MNPKDLRKGCIYFGLRFEDDACTRLLVNSYEYVGVNVHEPHVDGEEDYFCFRRLGSDDTLELSEKQLTTMLRLEELTTALKKWASEHANLLG